MSGPAERRDLLCRLADARRQRIRDGRPAFELTADEARLSAATAMRMAGATKPARAAVDGGEA